MDNLYANLRYMGKEKIIKTYLITSDDLFPEDSFNFFMQFHIDSLIERVYEKGLKRLEENNG